MRKILYFLVVMLVSLAFIGCPGADGTDDKSSDNSITAFSFDTANNSANVKLTENVKGSIVGTDISVTVPFGTDLTTLVPTIKHAGSISPTGSQDFTSPVTYTVTAADGSAQDYTVTVTKTAEDAKNITSFVFEATKNSAIPSDLVGVISGESITVNAPFGTVVTALTPTIVNDGTIDLTGSQDFTSPVTYTVTAADGSAQGYTVTVNVATENEAKITAFSFDSLSVVGIIDEDAKTIAVSVPNGTDVSALTPLITHDGVGITPTGSQDFTSPVTYTVTAEDGSAQGYTVTVTIATVPPSVTSVTIDGGNLAKTVGDAAVTLTATVVVEGGAAKTLTWSSSADAVATVTNAGELTFGGEGTATITATSTVDTSKTGTITVTVIPADRKPSEPINLTAIAGDAIVTLTWDAPTDTGITGGYGATGTILYYSVYQDGILITSNREVEDTSYTATGLTNGTEYAFTVAAVNNLGTGTLSSGANATPVETIYAVGDTGPAGGIIFYVAADDAAATAFGWRYLEAAPTDYVDTSGKTEFPWGMFELDIVAEYPDATNNSVGKGQIHTTKIVEITDAAGFTPPYAAKIADEFVFGGKSDWFLPSQDELTTLMNAFDDGTMQLIDDRNYWVSSDYNWRNGKIVNSKTPAVSATTSQAYKNGNHLVRIIRSF